MKTVIVQDLHDGQGLDILDGDYDLIESGLTTEQAVEWLEDDLNGVSEVYLDGFGDADIDGITSHERAEAVDLIEAYR